ncbi:helix-turn-helix domain-containing protein [Streptomyces spongiae]|uniref:Helix-turn-helix domain-containing protein n=1 Tax=Streptomyces spongiae TaxID=565072 RepID=A0A5N8XL32_9ACTN|nr:helix-turn-helix domain-containing protein [Streptomyces spongiae]MPY59944.1 helix-turn-helix domain-containing protein [Streptomyces spongiae]
MHEPETASAAPIRVAVALLKESSLFELAVPCAVFGGFSGDVEPPSPWYDLALCGTDPGVQHAPGGLRLESEHGLDALGAADLVIVPACLMNGYEPPAALLDVLREAHARGARVASLCSGAFVLAAAGLLDGREAATHWMYADELRRRHPRVRVNERALYVDDGDILTSAGTAAAIDLCLHIVRGDYGTAAAAEVGRRMVVAPHREGDQAQYSRPRTGAAPPAQGLAPVLDWAIARLEGPLTVAELADRADMSVRTFERHFAREVGTTPLKWLNQQRVARARELLETTDLLVDTIAERSGLGTGDALRLHFRRTLGTTPAAYRRTYRGAR